MKIAITKGGNKSWIGGATYLKILLEQCNPDKDKLKIYLINNGEEMIKL